MHKYRQSPIFLSVSTFQSFPVTCKYYNITSHYRHYASAYLFGITRLRHTREWIENPLFMLTLHALTNEHHSSARLPTSNPHTQILLLKLNHSNFVTQTLELIFYHQIFSVLLHVWACVFSLLLRKN